MSNILHLGFGAKESLCKKKTLLIFASFSGKLRLSYTGAFPVDIACGFPCIIFLSVSFFLMLGIQGESIGDVKFNSDGDRIGRYSVFQYQRVPKEGFK